MSDLLIPGLQKYIEDLLPPSDPILQEMERYAERKKFPIIGPQVGRFLFQLCKLTHPQNIFEMGSGFGYSAYWFCKGAPQAKIILTEHHQQNLDLAEKWLSRAGLFNQVVMKKGIAQEILRNSNQTYDIIFIDIDKEEYPDILPLVVNHLSPGGLLLTDNVLWYGRVAEDNSTDKTTASVKTYNKLLFEYPGLYSTIIPIRDGISMSLKTTDE